MQKLNSKVSDGLDFFKANDPCKLVEEFGSPLYVYSEQVLRARIHEMNTLVKYPNFRVNYSAKANNNLYLLKVMNDEGLYIDAMSPGEIFIEEKAGFSYDKMFFISNNVSAEEMGFAAERDIVISVDSISQLELLGSNFPRSRCAIRFNPGVGAGHHEKVITGGRKTKFGVNIEYIEAAKTIIEKYKLKLVGINQHIGSLFMDKTPYIEAAKQLMTIAKSFPELEFIDLGGGFGIPYRKGEGEPRLDLKSLGESLDEFMFGFAKEYGRQVTFKVEPGRYLTAECGILLGTVHAIKNNFEDNYAGTDLGFNVLARPVMYDAYHEIEIFRASGRKSAINKEINIVGNICETGDIIAKNRLLPEMFENDVVAVLDAGAYGYCMSSNYNNRLRPAEVFIKQDGSAILARKRDKLEDIFVNFEGLSY